MNIFRLSTLTFLWVLKGWVFVEGWGVCVCVHGFRRECVWVRFEGCGSEDVGVWVYMWEGR